DCDSAPLAGGGETGIKVDSSVGVGGVDDAVFAVGVGVFGTNNRPRRCDAVGTPDAGEVGDEVADAVAVGATELRLCAVTLGCGVELMVAEARGVTVSAAVATGAVVSSP